MILNKKIKPLNNYQELLTNLDRYKNIICDLWGVIHDGTSLYPAISEFITEIARQNKNLIFLSNAPRRAKEVALILNNLSINSQCYQLIVTSGEILFYDLKNNQDNNFKRFGSKFYYFGPKKDQNLLLGLNYQSSAIEDSDFVVLTGFHDDASNLSDEIKIIEQIYKKNLTIICANPDLKVVRQNGTESPCAGQIAQYYQQIGGNVIYYGKPYFAIYEHLVNQLSQITGQNFNKSDFIAIGDAIETDIKGSANFGIKNIFILNGIHRQDFINCKNQQDKINQIQSILINHNFNPDIIDFFIDNIGLGYK
jgi:HAD superfamily hydrolase (TIGR01459 family)